MGRLALACAGLVGALALGGCVHPAAGPAASSLFPSAWVVQSIAGKPVVGHLTLTLSFDESGKASGFGGCNRYSGQASVAGSGLTFGPLVSTRMACTSNQLNAQETRFLNVLGHAQTFEVDRDGWLVLESQGEKKPSRLAPDPRPRSAQGQGAALP